MNLKCLIKNHVPQSQIWYKGRWYETRTAPEEYLNDPLREILKRRVICTRCKKVLDVW